MDELKTVVETMGCFLLTIRNCAGEQEWTDQWLTQAVDIEAAEDTATELARNNWGDTATAEGHGIYSFPCGSLAQVDGVKEIPCDHYVVLRQYITVARTII